MVDGLPAAAQSPESEEPESEEWEIPLPVWIGEEHVRFAVRALVLHLPGDEPTGPRCLWDEHPHPCRLARWGRRVLAARGLSDEAIDVVVQRADPYIDLSIVMDEA
ncbi:hypothetical protein Pma05_19760 [Plantactinospora mayteni]|uniref:Uncharacterized protein n=1 Tax=Plantactinospora mayteni TaxID=566021 RepID=A0ABQ4EL02_9ACTN|nr:hypothetical protein Pma05_19760 [Plantactinospora mayteni]